MRTKTTTVSLDDVDLAMIEALKVALGMPSTTAVIRRAIQIACVAADNVNPRTKCFHFTKADGENALMLI